MSMQTGMGELTSVPEEIQGADASRPANRAKPVLTRFAERASMHLTSQERRFALLQGGQSRT